MNKIYTIEQIRSCVMPIAEKYGASKIYLFGSYARGEATANSDIDLRIEKGKLCGLIALAALHEDLEDALGKKVDLLTTGSLEFEFLQRIAKEEIIIYHNTQL